MIPGEYRFKDPEARLKANDGLAVKTIRVTNTGDRPVQVGSHFHFFEVNEALGFERTEALGFRLNIAAGTAVRFEPGDVREVSLVALSGKREVYGLNNRTDGSLPEATAPDAS